MWLFKILSAFLAFRFGISSATKPHIITILADDMGWNDVGFHGSDEIPTPNIDALAYNGVILNGHYTQALCTPSRSAFMTGKYPIHLGMQHLVILEMEPRGLPLNETIMPQHLKKNGYVTHAVGKWHLGFYKKEYTPTYRGFDTHYGYWQAHKDYYDHTAEATFTKEIGYDFRRNMTVDWSAKGKYSTDLFADEAVSLIQKHDVDQPMFMYLAHLAPHTGNPRDPLQAPDEEIAKFSHIVDPERRIYAAMVSMLDRSIGKVISALREKRMLENSIIVFISDNGAQTQGTHANHGSNYPLRGLKNSPWEGGTRGVATIWSPLIKKPRRVSHHLMHVSDWLPTLYSAAGLNVSDLGAIDGKDLWKSISEDVPSPRTDFVYNIDDVFNYAAIRHGDFKYIFGTTANGKSDQWYGSSGTDADYDYDEDKVLASQTASAIAGVITARQIREKHINIRDHKENRNFTMQLLNGDSLLNIRDSATVRCPERNPEGHLDTRCNPLISPCLFNIKEDPCEMVNLAASRPTILQTMEQLLLNYRMTMVNPSNVPIDPNSDPAKWNGVWVPWLDEEEVTKHKITFKQLSPLAIGLISAAGIGFLVVIVVLMAVSCKRSSKSSKMVLNTYEDPVDDLCAPIRFKDEAFEDQELKRHHSFKEALKSID